MTHPLPTMFIRARAHGERFRPLVRHLSTFKHLAPKHASRVRHWCVTPCGGGGRDGHGKQAVAPLWFSFHSLRRRLDEHRDDHRFPRRRLHYEPAPDWLQRINALAERDVMDWDIAARKVLGDAGSVTEIQDHGAWRCR